MKTINSKNKKYLKAIGIIIIILALPLTLILVKSVQDFRSSAALPDKLETEAGTLSSTGVSKQTDAYASGTSYVLFNKSSAPSPTPSTGAYGPRPAPATPTGSNVYTVPSTIDGTGNTDVTTALLDFVANRVPDGTLTTPNIIVFPAGKTYKITRGIELRSRNNLTLFGYGSTIYNANIIPSAHEAAEFRLWSSNNIKILGFRLKGANTWAGTRDAWGPKHGKGEFGMGIGIYEGNDQIEAADNHISNVFGDCIFNYTWDSPQSNNLNYHHNICELTGRQGITINEGNNIKVEWNIIRDVAMSAIATEDQRNKTATFENVYIRNNLISNWNWYHGQYEILSSSVGNPTIVTTKTDHYLPNGWLSFWGHSGVPNDGWVYNNATVLDSRRVSVPTYSSGGGATGTIEHYWESAAIYGSNDADQIIIYRNIYIENNKFMGGDVELKRNINSRPEIFYAGSVAKEGLYIRNNTFDLPTDQRTGPAVRAANVVNGEISGNNFQGQTINCSNCNITQNNNN